MYLKLGWPEKMMEAITKRAPGHAGGGDGAARGLQALCGALALAPRRAPVEKGSPSCGAFRRKIAEERRGALKSTA